ncbi:hypothetical protein HP15_p187g48 (plasmid) [Marinobacter adhaerens HP15]|uniref:Uncharacterized protein n=1 Tax=Marinobacter adhaerens (strain DSM 23420 / HP15) TaxID=225937 RepID=E4PS10_MARAH|nr:hypothetical protein HP15_p187g48 [Marinobacter adhaerens HP15]
MVCSALLDGFVSFKLGLAVYAQGACGAGFLPWGCAVAGIDVVAAVVDQAGIVGYGVLSQLTWQAGVQALGFGLMLFGGVYGRPGGGVYDQGWLGVGKVVIYGLCVG